MANSFLNVIAICGIIFAIWLAGNGFAKQVHEHEIIRPEPGIKCVVVSRMFNVSTDCWKVPKKIPNEE